MATAETTEIKEPEAELVACAAGPHYFLSNFACIYDPDRPDWIPFRLWPAQSAVLDQIWREMLSIVLKARQLGLSWLMLGYGLWEMIFRPPARFLCFSRRETDADYLLGRERLRGMIGRLPSWLLTAMNAHPTNDATHSLCLANGSTAHAFPCNAGDSYTATFALLDEYDLLTAEEQTKLLSAVKPTIDHGGKMVVLSRADKSKPESPFKRLYRESQEGRGLWKPAFLSWSARPDRTPAWYERQKADSLARTGSLDSLHEHYPATDAEAMSPRSLDKRLPTEWLVRCYRPAPPLSGPFRSPFGPPTISGLTLYGLPVTGRRYIVGADPAEGNPTSDPSALTVLELNSGEEMASLAGRFEPATFAAYVHAVGQFFNHAPVMVERNNHGHAVLLWLRDNSSLYRLYGHDGNPGWHTTTKGKSLLYDRAAEAIRDGEAIIHGLETFSQLASVEGSTQRAPQGQHDDRAVAFALAMAARARLLVEMRGAADWEQGPCVLTPGRVDPYGPAEMNPRDWRAGYDAAGPPGYEYDGHGPFALGDGGNLR
jgi:hypothetical protein